jgi:hypothetical protein
MTNGLYELFWQVPTGLSAIDYDLMFGVDCEYRVWDSTGQTLADAQNHNWNGESPNNITNLTSGNFVAGNWIRFKIITPNFVDGGLKVFYQTGTSASTVTLTIDVNTIDQDFLIPISKDVSSFSITPASGDVYVELRTDSPSVEDYCLYPATVYDLAQNATLLAAINAAFAANSDAKVALHIWVVDRPTTVDLVVNFVDGSVYNSHTNHNQNLKYPEQLKGEDQEFDGLVTYDEILNFQQIDYLTKPVFINSSFYINSLGASSQFIFWAEPKDTPLSARNGKGASYVVVLSDGRLRILIAEYEYISPSNQGNKGIYYDTLERVKIGYNNISIHWNASYTGGPSSETDCDIYINGKKCNITALNVGTFPASPNAFSFLVTNEIGVYTDVLGVRQAYFDGKIKKLQYMDGSTFTITDELIRKVFTRKCARNIVPASSFELDFEPTTLAPTDISPNGYTLTPFGGYVSNPEFLDF